MKKKNLLFIALIMGVMTIGFALAGNFEVQFPSGTPIFTVDTAGNANATGNLSENSVILSEIYLALSGGTLSGDVNMTGGNLNLTNGELFIGLSGPVSIWLYNQTEVIPNMFDQNLSTGQNVTFYNVTGMGNASFPDIHVGGETVLKWLYNQTSMFNIFDQNLSTGQNVTFYNMTVLGNASFGDIHIGTESVAKWLYNQTGIIDFTNVAFFNNSQAFQANNTFLVNTTFSQNIFFDADGLNLTREGSASAITVNSNDDVIIILS